MIADPLEPEPVFYPHDPEKWEWLNDGDPVPCNGCGRPHARGWYQVAGDAWYCEACKSDLDPPARRWR